MHQVIRDANTHSQLQDDLVEHLWMLKGNAAKFYYLFSIYLDLKLCIICVYKLCFYNLYESSGTIFQVSRRSGAISSRLGATTGMPTFKKIGPNLRLFGLYWAFGKPYGGAAGKTPSPYTNRRWRPSPHMAQKLPAPDTVLGASGDAPRDQFTSRQLLVALFLYETMVSPCSRQHLFLQTQMLINGTYTHLSE
jgi:hypothetical protein